MKKKVNRKIRYNYNMRYLFVSFLTLLLLPVSFVDNSSKMSNSNHSNISYQNDSLSNFYTNIPDNFFDINITSSFQGNYSGEVTLSYDLYGYQEYIGVDDWKEAALSYIIVDIDAEPFIDSALYNANLDDIKSPEELIPIYLENVLFYHNNDNLGFDVEWNDKNKTYDFIFKGLPIGEWFKVQIFDLEYADGEILLEIPNNIDILELQPTSSSIILNYYYYQTEDWRDYTEPFQEKVFLEITNKSTGEVGMYKKKIEEGENKIIIDTESVDNVSFNPIDNFELRLWTQNNSGNGWNENSITKNIELLSEAPEFIINSLEGKLDNIVLNYSYSTGNPAGNEKAYIDIKNITENTSPEIIELSPGNNIELILNSDNLTTIPFNLFDEFELHFYTVDSYGGEEINIIENIYLEGKGPIIGLEINKKSNVLSFEFYYIEKNDSDNINATIIIKDPKEAKIKELTNVGINDIKEVDLAGNEVGTIEVYYANIINGKESLVTEKITKENISGNVMHKESSGSSWITWTLVGIGTTVGVILIAGGAYWFIRKKS